MTDTSDGDRLLVPVEVEAVEGWDPAPPMPDDWKPTWYSTQDLVAALEPEMASGDLDKEAAK